MPTYLEWFPDSLYELSILAIVRHFGKFRTDIKILPDNILFDVYYKVYTKGRLCNLCHELSDLKTFARVLKVVNRRPSLHRCFQSIVDHGQSLTSVLADQYLEFYDGHNSNAQGVFSDVEKLIQLGFNLGGFLNDAGWHYSAEKVYTTCVELCQKDHQSLMYKKCLDCYANLMHVQNANCKFSESEQSWKMIQVLLEKLPEYNKAVIYSENSALLFALSHYNQAYEYCNMALKEVQKHHRQMPAKSIVDIFRQATKTCVVKREFKKAELVIKFAVQFAKDQYGEDHLKYSDALMDYGFYLLNLDFISQAVDVYQAALDIRKSIFKGKNIHVASAHEDLAYSTYVKEYSAGRFDSAKEHAEKAISIVTGILPADHLALASSKRVKALILEEVAIDSHDKNVEAQLLKEAQDLHLASLSLATKAFGEKNVQTAKHYGNLGRLYQSMHRYEEAEQMHVKSIKIKEDLLGKEDYEVALSVGHLASLYNYDMNQYEKAEKLYLRSIKIGRQLFGKGYSGLEYDYRGLLRLYQAKNDYDSVGQYANILNEWSRIRATTKVEEMKPFDIKQFDGVKEVLEHYFSIS